MKSRDELKKFFDQEILPHLPRQFVPHSAKNFLPIFGGAFLLMSVLIYIDLTIGMIAFVAFNLWFWWYIKIALPKMEQRYHRLVVVPMIHAIDPTIRHIPNRGIREAQFKDAQMLPDRSYIFSSSNLLTYQNDGIEVKLSRIALDTKTSDGDEDTIFSGLFAITDARRSIKGTTIISFDIMEKHFGFVGRGLQFSSIRNNLKKIRLDSSEFEKEYIVYTTDPIEANFLLTFTVMEKLTHLIRQYQLFPAISFVKDKIYIAIDEPSFLRSNGWTFEGIEPTLNALSYTMETIEAIHRHHRL